ncbi:hypothetical protein [Microbispora sp. ATCC PTA-5024]|uniref:hypothetical protein n=1 Tax=Microbispora sp. ATCC PTA-5024 TaxID=316330 RepID=UPI0003DCB6DD|nr:hypothetical protein [Microbispora sp. ATCC PTA-5024]ETK36567.1 hypothetical protein MPTA5024_07800 [Microbispora sp. ATCC PTA-5024]
MSRLDTLRGPVPPRDHNARTIAALAANPGCNRRAVMDAAGIDKDQTARHLGYPVTVGQSVFAITRARAFEEQVKANGCAQLLTLLRDKLELSLPEVAYDDVENVGGDRNLRHSRTKTLLRQAAEARGGGTLFDHPMLRLNIAGKSVYLEPALIAFQLKGRFHVVEIKSFAVIDGQADAGQVAAAARQSAVYVHALRELFADLGLDPGLISHDVILVCPENFANAPTATLVDVRQQLTVLKRQLSRLTRIDTITNELPMGLTFDLMPDEDGAPTRSRDELLKAVSEVEARYAPECLASCEMAFFCRDEARSCGSTDALGRTVRDQLGGLESVATVLGLADGTLLAGQDQAEIASQLRLVRQFRLEATA